MDRIGFRVHPMLATLVAAPFHERGWVFEEKYDGDRLLAYKQKSRVRLLSRNGKVRTGRFPRIAAAIAGLRAQTLILDGEVVVFDTNGFPGFSCFKGTTLRRCMPSLIAFFTTARTCDMNHYLCGAPS